MAVSSSNNHHVKLWAKNSKSLKKVKHDAQLLQCYSNHQGLQNSDFASRIIGILAPNPVSST